MNTSPWLERFPSCCPINRHHILTGRAVAVIDVSLWNMESFHAAVALFFRTVWLYLNCKINNGTDVFVFFYLIARVISSPTDSNLANPTHQSRTIWRVDKRYGWLKVYRRCIFRCHGFFYWENYTPYCYGFFLLLLFCFFFICMFCILSSLFPSFRLTLSSSRWARVGVDINSAIDFYLHFISEWTYFRWRVKK